MTPMKTLVLASLAGALAACSPGPETEPETAVPAADEAETAALDAAALHELLLAQADSLVPSDWHTGAPAPDTALAYWYLPELEPETEVTRTTDCTALPDGDRTYDCTLSFTAERNDSEPEDQRTVTALYRFDVRQNDDGRLELVSPNVRWAVTG